MIKLNATALAKNTATDGFWVERFGKFTAYFLGDLNNETLTMQHSMDGVTWTDFYAATVLQTYSANGDVCNAVDYELGGKRQFRWIMSNGAGTPANVFVQVDGQNVAPVRD